MKILITAILLLALYGYGWVGIEAHTPCDIAEFREAPEPEPTCGYENAVHQTVEGVRLAWITESEVDNEGFNVLRRTGKKGDYEVINGALIPAEGGPAFGAAYEFVDDTAKRGRRYFYLLEDIDTSGISTLHGEGACTVGVDDDCDPIEVRVERGKKRGKKHGKRGRK